MAVGELTRGSSRDSQLRRRHGAHTVYLRPVEARKLFCALDALMCTDDQDGADDDLQRVRRKLWAVEWDQDGPGEGVDG